MSTESSATEPAGKPSDPTKKIIDQQAQLAKTLPFGDTADYEATDRGFIGGLDPDVVKAAGGRVVWDDTSYDFVKGPCPDSVNPSLWRQSQLVVKQGLYEVMPGIYQVRGLDLSNMTIIEGDTGIIVIDPLISVETAQAALALYRKHRGDRPVKGLMYTHCHIDHFGGAAGVISVEDAESGKVPVLAPQGFLEHAVAENVFCGVAMARRAAYMYGAALPRGDRGGVGAGLGMTTSTGTLSLIAPTKDITTTGQEEVIDGVRMVFQMTPGTEAPAEMNFYFPDHRAMCMAENATHNQHNLLTLRGALVRDAHVWAKYLTQTITMFAGKIDAAFSSHHWPTWGGDEVIDWLSSQRDMYAYLHDQTLRLLNQGYVGSEIAEMMVLPPALENKWYNRGYYGSTSHNVKAIYQRYMGWFDGNPAHLWEHPPVESGKLHVAAMGGADALLATARAAYDAGDYRWVAQLVNYLVFADPDNAEAKALQADALEQLGYGSENATWRNFYLSGANELRNGNFGTPTEGAPTAQVEALTIEQIFDAVSFQIDGPKAWDLHLINDWIFTDKNETHRSELRNGVLIHFVVPPDFQGPAPDATFTLTKDELVEVLTGAKKFGPEAKSGSIKVTGDPTKLEVLATVLDKVNTNFNIVTP